MATIAPVSAEDYEAEIAKDRTEGGSAIAVRAAETLGYTALMPMTQPRIDTHLLAILREHGISFYRPDDVRAYQTKMRRKAEAANRFGWYTLGGAIGFVILAILMTVHHQGQPDMFGVNPIWSLVPWLSFVGMIALTIFYGVMADDHPLRAEWKESSLKREGIVPKELRKRDSRGGAQKGSNAKGCCIERRL